MTFEDGAYIVGIEKEYEQYNFSKVKTINGVDIEEIRTKLKGIISGDNKYNVDYRIDNYINDLDYLVGLKIISNVNNVDILLEKDENEFCVNFNSKISRNFVIEKIEDEGSSEFNEYQETKKQELIKIIENSVGKEKEKLEKYLKKISKKIFISYNYVGNCFLKIENIPYKMKPLKSYTFETFPKSKAIVLRYNKCFSEEYKPFDKFSAEFF